MILTARGAEQHSNGTDTAQAFINLALALGLPGQAVLRLRHHHRPGQRAGRPRARPEGRPAARLPQARRPGATARTSPRCGASTRTSCPGPGSRRSRCSTGMGTDGGVRALLVLASNIVVSAPDANRVRGPAATRWTCWWSPTSSCPRPRRSPTWCCPTAQWAEEEGTMTNLEGRVIRRKPRAAAAGRRARRPAAAEAAGRPARPRHSTSPPTRATVFDELRRASAGGIADYAGHHLRADRRRAGRLLAVSRRGPSRARRGCSPSVPDRRRPGAVHPGRASRAGRDARRRSTRTC